MAEYFDVYDSNNCSTGEVAERSIVHTKGYWHRTSQVWIMNSKREVLCNLRSKSKDLFANYWDLSIGGHVEAGDNYESTALRELKEEVGIETNINKLAFLSDEKVEGVYHEKNLIDREHARLFLFTTTLGIKDFLVQEEEIERIEFFPINYLIDSIVSNKNLRVVPIKHFFVKILRTLKIDPLNLKGEKEV